MTCCLSILRVNNCETCRSSRVFLLRERNHSPNINSSLQLSFRSERHRFDPPCGVYISESLSLKHDEKKRIQELSKLNSVHFFRIKATGMSSICSCLALGRSQIEEPWCKSLLNMIKRVEFAEPILCFFHEPCEFLIFLLYQVKQF